MVDLPRRREPLGSVTVLHGESSVPFPIRRVYYLYDVPGGESRGGHAHRELEQLIVAISGSFVVRVDEGTSTARFEMSLPWKGLYIPSMCWREIEDFSTNSVCLVLASQPYDESDYIRSHEEFRASSSAIEEGGLQALAGS